MSTSIGEKDDPSSWQFRYLILLSLLSGFRRVRMERLLIRDY